MARSDTEQDILATLTRIENLSKKIHLQLVSIEQRLTFLEEQLGQKIKQEIQQKLEELVPTVAITQKTN